MASAFPHQPPVEYTPRKQTDIVIDGDEQSDIVQALSSKTAQRILATLRDEPRTATDIADAVNTSLQNAQYHLKRLSEVDLITPVDTWYSAQGRKMTVYALSAEEIVIQFRSTD